jgi:acyl-CoA thioester hydrolase
MILQNTYTLRVAYADTDQMGYVYYGQYARYFELARTELLRKFEISYKTLEAQGVMMPVTHFSTRYLKAALYDDLLSIEVTVNEKPDRFMVFSYVVYNEEGQKLCDAETKLIFVDATTRKSIHAPEFLVNALLKPEIEKDLG